jgi:CRP-like cAMP-binding protein
LIDRIRQDIQQRLDQLLAEVEKLHRALAALDPRGRATAQQGERSKPGSAEKGPARTASPEKPRARTRPAAAGTPGNPTRTAPGETKVKVLAALSGDTSLTAGEVAKVTGLARPTVSTTLSRLAKSGEIAKAERGYRLPVAGATADG